MLRGSDVIFVTGGTGNQGGAVARELLAHGHKVRAMTRHPEGEGAQALKAKGAEIVAGNLDDAASLERAMTGAWGVFAVQNTWEAGVEGEETQGKRQAEAARKVGVQHYVYTSVASAHRKTGIPHFENKYRIEDTVRTLGFPSHVIIRPVFFMENFLSPWFLPSLQKGTLAVGIEPETVLQMIAARDIGRYGAWAFEHHGELNRREIDIAGAQLTMPEAAAILGKAMRHDVAFFRVPIEQVRQASDDYASMLEWFDRVGYNVDIPGNARTSGIAPTSLGAWASSVDWAPAPAAH